MIIDCPRRQIDNPRNQAPEAVDRLRRLLCSAPPKREDRQRPNFFELDDADRVYYVYISPTNGTVIFLATWARERRPSPAAGRAA